METAEVTEQHLEVLIKTKDPVLTQIAEDYRGGELPGREDAIKMLAFFYSFAYGFCRMASGSRHDEKLEAKLSELQKAYEYRAVKYKQFLKEAGFMRGWRSVAKWVKELGSLDIIDRAALNRVWIMED